MSNEDLLGVTSNPNKPASRSAPAGAAGRCFWLLPGTFANESPRALHPPDSRPKGKINKAQKDILLCDHHCQRILSFKTLFLQVGEEVTVMKGKYWGADQDSSRFPSNTDTDHDYYDFTF